MNGELMNLLNLTLAAKQYLRTGEIRESLVVSEWIEGYDFNFAERTSEKELPAARVETVEGWLKELKDRGATDVKLMADDHVEDESVLLSLNGTPCCLICFYDDGVTVWNKRYFYNLVSKKCHAGMTERVLPAPPQDKPSFKDVSQDMAALLERLRVLAQKLELSQFAFRFHAAQKKLQANFVEADGAMRPVHRRLLAAAAEAYVFDGEEPWTAVGREAAEKKGLLEPYESLTKDLYRGIVLSCLYAANEW